MRWSPVTHLSSPCFSHPCGLICFRVLTSMLCVLVIMVSLAIVFPLLYVLAGHRILLSLSVFLSVTLCSCSTMYVPSSMPNVLVYHIVFLLVTLWSCSATCVLVLHNLFPFIFPHRSVSGVISHFLSYHPF